jgi:alpha-beta hydrolase superfamily lysophospholipase
MTDDKVDNVATESQIRDLAEAAREMLKAYAESRHASHEEKRARESLVAALAAFPMRYWEP